MGYHQAIFCWVSDNSLLCHLGEAHLMCSIPLCPQAEMQNPSRCSYCYLYDIAPFGVFIIIFSSDLLSESLALSLHYPKIAKVALSTFRILSWQKKSPLSWKG